MTKFLATSRHQLLLFGLSLSLIACGGSTQTANGGTDQDELEGATASQAVAAGVRLLYAGEQPQRELRHLHQADRSERMSIELIMVAAAALGNTITPEMVSPPIHISVEVGPTQVVDNDRMRYRMRISGASISPTPDTPMDVLAEMADEVAALQQVDGFLEVDRMGNTLDSSFRTRNDLPTSTRTMLGNIRRSVMTVPFPEEPVGVGAQWVDVRPIDHGTAIVRQTVMYTLTDLDGDRGHLEVVFRQEATPQTMRSQDPTVSGMLHSYEAAGVGFIEFDLNQMATWSDLDVTTQMRSTVTVDGASGIMQMRVRTAVRTSPAQ